MKCHNCQQNLSDDNIYGIDRLVSSDCQPIRQKSRLGFCSFCGLTQKLNDKEWQKVCDHVYANYKIYSQGNGEEQKVKSITTGELRPRSELIVNFLNSRQAIGEIGSVLDIGCGNGAFLTSFFESKPKWSINGTELNPNFKDDIDGISKNSRFIDGADFQNLSENFTLVSLIHCIEHITSPSDYLKSLGRLFETDGWLLIQVPDVEKNPFDLMIADHASHFSADSLRRVVEDSGIFEIVECGNLVLGKELTLLAKFRPNHENNPAPTTGRDFLKNHIKWIENLQEYAIKLADQNTTLSIFGSSIAATWFSIILEGKISNFIDEDTNRSHAMHVGIEIIPPNEVRTGSPVFIPLEPSLAKAIGEKLSDLGWVVYPAPPL